MYGLCVIENGLNQIAIHSITIWMPMNPLLNSYFLLSKKSNCYFCVVCENFANSASSFKAEGCHNLVINLFEVAFIIYNLINGRFMINILERKLKQEYELRNDIISFDKSQRFLDSRLVKMLVRELMISRLKWIVSWRFHTNLTLQKICS